MEKAVDQLQQLGFSPYEAKAYIGLLRRNPINGYELAKASGIPRPNIYAVLQKLEERGAVLHIDSDEGVRYVPVEPGELINRLRSRMENSLDETQSSLEGMSAEICQEQVWNSQGYPALFDHASSIIDSAKESLVIGIWPQESTALKDRLQAARDRNVEMTTLCLAACPQPCTSCQGNIFRYHPPEEGDSRWLLIVSDQAEVLFGEIQPDQDAGHAAGQEIRQGDGNFAQAARTRQKVLVNLATWFVRHHIALSVLLEGLGDRLDPLLDPQTRSLLSTIRPSGSDGGWLDNMKALIRKSS
ncbi:MAG: TrmB family transcriptional regulator [Omnitrophica WOR_2 bacterium]